MDIPNSNRLSLDSIWTALLDGDPGPALAFVDALLEHDMAYAAGGFLQDLAERLNDAPTNIEDAQQLSHFVEATKLVLQQASESDDASSAPWLEADD